MTRPIRIAHVTTVDLTLRFLLLGQMRRQVAEGFEVTGISAPGPWVAQLEQAGIRHVPWHRATRSWDPASDARAFGELLRIFRRERFDLVHTHNPKPGILGRVAARMAGVPCVVNTVHGFYATAEDPTRKRWAVLALERLAARFSDIELYQSEEDLDWARRVGVVSSGKSVLLGNGTDLARFDPSAVSADQAAALRHRLGIPANAPVVGTVGRMVREKGYREFFRAAESLHAANPDVTFLALGEADPGKGDAIEEEEILRAGKHVLFTGWREDVRDLLAVMDVFVLASWREGLPRSAIEAAAMGKPLILTDIRGCREVVRHGIEGFLVPPRNPGQLAAAIARLIADDRLRGCFGAAARARAVERFDEARVAETVMNVYGELLERKRILGATRSHPGPGEERTEQVRMRPARAEDARDLARLHREALPTGFLPSLGDRFVALLYRALAQDPEAVALVAEDRQGVVGFAAAVPSVRTFYKRFYIRHGVAAAMAAAPRLLRLSILRRARETAGYPNGMHGLPEAELLSIAVSEHARAGGVGSALAEEVLNQLARQGVSEVRVVVGANNDAANRFYAKVGFRPARRIAVHHGQLSNVLVTRCPSS
ncbi:MAG: GNAT family N-acetyltransferase [Actinomycetota bacterium]